MTVKKKRYTLTDTLVNLNSRCPYSRILPQALERIQKWDGMSDRIVDNGEGSRVWGGSVPAHWGNLGTGCAPPSP